MERPTLEIDGAAIVLVGSFNPAIFQPTWLVANGLIRSQEGDSAEIGVIHPEISAFSADWLRLQVSTDRFMVHTADAAHFSALRDLVVGLFRILEHTPLRQLGMNRLQHYRMPSRDQWHALGHSLVPKDPWTTVLGPEAGMRSLVVEGKEREADDSIKRKLSVRVEPSLRIDPGVYFEINDHSEASQDDASRKLVDHLGKNWSEVMTTAAEVPERVLDITERSRA